jgi:hypothetical protein
MIQNLGVKGKRYKIMAWALLYGFREAFARHIIALQQEAIVRSVWCDMEE